VEESKMKLRSASTMTKRKKIINQKLKELMQSPIKNKINKQSRTE
jgi:hypothetical protein